MATQCTPQDGTQAHLCIDRLRADSTYVDGSAAMHTDVLSRREVYDREKEIDTKDQKPLRTLLTRSTSDLTQHCGGCPGRVACAAACSSCDICVLLLWCRSSVRDRGAVLRPQQLTKCWCSLSSVGREAVQVQCQAVTMLQCRCANQLAEVQHARPRVLSCSMCKHAQLRSLRQLAPVRLNTWSLHARH